jgi:hypothetical protein
MRAADAAELEAIGQAPEEGVLHCLDTSEFSISVFFDGEIAAMAGVIPIGDGNGVVWTLSGNAVDKHRKAFLKTSLAVLDFFLSNYGCLYNAIDARYTGALRWARWLGCVLEDPRPIGVHGELFVPFSVRRGRA